MAISDLKIEYFLPDNTKNKREARLYEKEAGIYFLECDGAIAEHETDTVSVLYAFDLYSGEQYTLVNCAFWESLNDSRYKYKISEVYIGSHLDKATKTSLYSVTARNSILTIWLNQNRFNSHLLSPENGRKSVELMPPMEKKVTLEDGIHLQLMEWCNFSHSRRRVLLQADSSFRIVSKEPVSRFKLNKYVKGFNQFILLFSNHVPKLCYLEYADMEKNKIKLLINREKTEVSATSIVLKYPEIESSFETMLQRYYKNIGPFSDILDLIEGSYLNRAPEISFLNLTAALEVYHKNFKEKGKDSEKKEIFQLLKNRGTISNGKPDWYQIVRYYHLLDSMTESSFIKDYFPDRINFVTKLKNSRNYYTHYSPTEEAIWSKSDLFLINRRLRTFCKGLILQELGLSMKIVGWQMSNGGALIVEERDKNQYSLYYKD